MWQSPSKCNWHKGMQNQHLKWWTGHIVWTSVCPVVEGHCEVPRGCLYFYSLFFTALDALPCPAPTLPCPCTALPLPLPCLVSNLPFAARDRRRKLHREFFFFFFPRGRFCAFGFRDSWRWSQVR
jgi:hypothetical protein